MVKGVAKQAVIVRPPEPKEFEQAIFILSAPGDESQLKSPEDMLALADDLASKYTIPVAGGRPVSHHHSAGWKPWVYFVAGAGATGIAWLIAALIPAL